MDAGPPPSYDDIKQFIADAIAARSRDGVPDYLKPSKYWLDFCKFSAYVRTLDDQELRRIRYHTWHLTADNYQVYYFISDLNRRCLLEEYEYLIGCLGTGRHLGEGESGIGFDTPWGKINKDLARQLQVLVDLRRHDAFPSDRPQTVLEIGGGFGGLAATMMRYNPATACVLLDLEETLFFQAVNLSNAFGRGAVVLCDDRRPMPAPEAGKFYLVPQARGRLVEPLRFDVAVNQQSMQEMSEAQVDHYCDLLEKTTARFYSCNLDHHVLLLRSEKRIVTSLNALLLKRFGRPLWDSYRDCSSITRLGRRWGRVKTVADLLKSVVVRSRAASRLYLALWGEPVRRYSDVNLRRLIFRCRS